MRKLITMLSALTITSSIASLAVACNSKENENNDSIINPNPDNGNNENNKEKGLDLNKLNSDMFQQLDILPLIIGSGPIKTKKINDIDNDTELIAAIKSHIKVKLLKNVFGLDNLVPKTEAEAKALKAFMIFVGATKPVVLDIDVNVMKPNKKYEVLIKKEKWEDVEVDSFLNPEGLDLEPYYNLIKGSKAIFTVTRGNDEIIDEKKFNINNLSASMFQELKIIDFGYMTIETKTLDEIKSNQEMIHAIDSSIWVMVWSKIFGFEEFDVKNEEMRSPILKFVAMSRAVVSPTIKVNLKEIKPNQKYEVFIEKEKWENIEISPEFNDKLETDITLDDIKPYYDLIMEKTASFIITK